MVVFNKEQEHYNCCPAAASLFKECYCKKIEKSLKSHGLTLQEIEQLLNGNLDKFDLFEDELYEVAIGKEEDTTPMAYKPWI